MKQLVKKYLPKPLYRFLRNTWYDIQPLSWLGTRRLKPIHPAMGWNRVHPIDRVYIEQFLQTHASDIKGRVLEVGDAAYTREYGNGKVTQIDVLHSIEGNPEATIVDDLTYGQKIPDNTFDCFICTQMLFMIYDMHTAVQTIYRILKPGGVVLVTVPGISQICRYDLLKWGDYWRFTSPAAEKLFCEAFPPENVELKVYGNILTAIGLLHGLSSKKFKQAELDYHDPDYEVTIGIRACKPVENY